MGEEGSTEFVDQLVDDLLPEDLDWRDKVRTYPVPALAVAAIGGFLVGRSRGLSLLGSLSTFVVREISSGFATILGEEPTDS